MRGHAPEGAACAVPVHYEIDGPVKLHQREVDDFIQRMEQEIARHTGVLADDELVEYRQSLGISQKIAELAVE